LALIPYASLQHMLDGVFSPKPHYEEEMPRRFARHTKKQTLTLLISELLLPWPYLKENKVCKDLRLKMTGGRV
jgi:hypothetical protein